MRRLHLLPLLVALAGCGSAADPPAEGPSASVEVEQGTVRLDTGERTVTFGDRTVAAGVGPAAIAPGGNRVYVTDAVQGALLTFDFEPELELQRRDYLPGRPTALVADPERERLYVALTDRDEVAALAYAGRPAVLERFPTVPRPRALEVDPATGAVTVTGAGGQRDVLRTK